ncbi:MAG: DPP IV N-terminal domain-containing protein [Planctomycetota bacterium]|nr:DPP IV N-terminal domain-containing protein [Planctomycetota bacterium]MDA1162136.1 DPP IV N-terminal domain-containing protein [Planctomycetota bacterium]
MGLGNANAQESGWQEETESRLRAIYERGEFRGRTFQAEWLPDSSGYTVRELNPETNEPVHMRYDVRTGERTEVKLASKLQIDPERRLSPDGKSIIEFRDRNLFVRDLATGRRAQLTKRLDDRDIWYRQPAWSPDGKQIAFIESDETNVRLRPVLVPTDPSYPGIQNNRFARVGEKIATLRVGVVDSEGKKIQWLPIEAPGAGFYLGQVDWAGNSNEVFVEKLSRFRDRREFLLANIDSGNVERIYHESNEAWAVGSQGKNSGLTWIRDGKAFIVVSEKDGWRHAFAYSREGKELSLLTPGKYDVIDRATIDEDGGWFYFHASPDNGTQKYLHRVPLDGTGTLERITPEAQPGTHDFDFSPDARWAFHTWSTLDKPPVVELVELPKYRAVRVLEDNSELRARMKNVISHPTEFLQLDIGDGVSMDAWMIKPKDFDESKKYPVFIYVYGEPHAQTVLDNWGAAQIDFHRVVADLGYLVVSIDNRGTPAPKGAAWRRSIFGSLGPLSTDDQAAGLKELGRMRPYVDLSRVAIWGWSGGGSNTLNAMFRKPDLYHVGIAVVPKPQPHLYNAWFQEVYMRTREVNPDGYQRSAPINFANGLQGKLLMITGSGETNTHIQIIEGLVDRLIELGKPFDYMVYPNRDHGLREGNGTVVHVRMRIIRYLIEHLPRGPRQ